MLHIMFTNLFSLHGTQTKFQRSVRSDIFIVVLIFVGNAAGAVGFDELATEHGYQIVERGANERKWARWCYVTNETGALTSLTNSSFVEVASGMHYLHDGSWVESQDCIQLRSDGTAAAVEGPIKAYFQANLAAKGAITLVTERGLTFECQPACLVYHERSSGLVVRLATIKECEAELLPPNQVVWKHAFDNIDCDILFTYTKGAVESDLILTEQPRFKPEDYGFNPELTTMELWHFWTASKKPALAKLQVYEWDTIEHFTDTAVDFEELYLASGEAFIFSKETTRRFGDAASVTSVDPSREGIRVLKAWHARQDRNNVLIEALYWPDVSSRIDRLPKSSSVGATNVGTVCQRALALEEELGPNLLGSSPGTISIASGDYALKGLVLDWQGIPGGSYGAYTFGNGYSSMTYYISGSCHFASNVTLFGKTVLKFDNADVHLQMAGTINCYGTPSDPTILTSKSDDLYGEEILGSAHFLAPGQAGNVFVTMPGPPIVHPKRVRGLKIRGANIGILNNGRSLNKIADCSAEFCSTDIFCAAGSVVIESNAKRCGVTYPGTDCVGNQFSEVCGGLGGNELPDEWEYRFFGRADADEYADSDGDCIPNKDEYSGGTNPTTLPHFWIKPAPDTITTYGASVFLTSQTSVPCQQYWFRGGAALGGGSSLNLSNVGPQDDGVYNLELICPFNQDWYQGLPYRTESTVAVLTGPEMAAFQWFHTTGRDLSVSVFNETQPPGHGHRIDGSPVLTWNTNSIIYGCSGFTGIAPCWTREGAPGQSPVTLISRRHAITRGHGIGDPNALIGHKVFFLDSWNVPHSATIQGAYNNFETSGQAEEWDFTILLFSAPVSTSIEHLAVGLPPANTKSKWHVTYTSCQHGILNVTYPYFPVHPLAGGDGGSPCFVPGLGNGGLVMTELVDCHFNWANIQPSMDILSNRYQVPTYNLTWSW